ncbi:hypothetical protein [Litoreibacter roseus]|uniref:Uncharacterized protein n=1 Tax=Litoreibacter roseus TaxID=2601869 RepID=A0A6N6JE52_9RHOB|nr:hypothetical protein [Litoreibacter roseus]GFE63558.1 hypothetical protein KIN_06320 [Litoreibacter roseus]
MVEISDIVDSDSLETWLKSQNDRKTSLTTAYRCAMRVAPLTLENLLADPKKADFVVAIYLRQLLISGVGTKYTDAELWEAAATAATVDASWVAADLFSSRTFIMTAASAAVSTVARTDRAGAASKAAEAAENATWVAAESEALPDLFPPLRQDCSALSAGGDLEHAALWPGTGNPLANSWRTLKSDLATWSVKAGTSDSEVGHIDWSFWIDWYERALNGAEDRWEMLREVALLDREIWEGDPVTLMARIYATEEKHRLLELTKQLKSELEDTRQQAASIVQRSHNRPPGLVESERRTAPQILVIWNRLEEAEQELERAAPDPRILGRIGEAILKAVATCASYSAQKLDVVATNAAKAIGAAGGGAIVTVLAAKQPAIQNLAKALMDYAAKLPLP